jgi:hypothetical protein
MDTGGHHVKGSDVIGNPALCAIRRAATRRSFGIKASLNRAFTFFRQNFFGRFLL